MTNKNKETKAFLDAEQTKVLEVQWEWIIIQVVSIKNLPKEFFGTNDADPYVHVKALGSEPDIAFDKHCNQYRFPVRWNEASPTWDQMGMVAYVKGSAEEINFTIRDKNYVTSDKTLLSQNVPIPTLSSSSLGDDEDWEKVVITEGKTEIIVRMFRGIEDDNLINTPRDHEAMGLTEQIFDLSSGDKASLVYKKVDGNKKAVFYFPGYFDSFAHPHILDAFLSRGYDFYSLDPHGCGRTGKYLEDPKLAHSVSNFNEYEEDVDKALDFAGATTNYESVLAYCHSTGALVLTNYHMVKSGETPFTGCILNGPFLDWGHVGGSFNEFLLEHMGILTKFDSDRIVREADGLDKWQLMLWILYRWDISNRPLIQLHLTGKFAHAATMVQNKLLKHTSKDPLMGDIPALLMSSSGDDTIDHDESVERMRLVFSNPEIVEFKHNNHDVALSFTKQLNDDAVNTLTEWLDTKAP